MRTRPRPAQQKPAAARFGEFKRALPVRMRPSTQPPPPLPPVSLASPAPVGAPSTLSRPAPAMPPVQPPSAPTIPPAPEVVVATNEALVAAAASAPAGPPPVSPPRAELPDLPRILQSPLPAFPNGPPKVENASTPPVRRGPTISMPPPVPPPDPLQSLNIASLPPAIAASLARLAGANGSLPPAAPRPPSSHDLSRDGADRPSTAEAASNGPPSGPAAERK